MEFYFENILAPLFIILAVPTAALITYFVYFRNSDSKVLSGVQKRVLAGLRFTSLMLIFLFLLSPVIEKNKRIKQRPILAIALDNSASVARDSVSVRAVLKELENEFGDDYQLEIQTFGEKTESSALFTGTEKYSDYSEMLRSSKSNFFNQNLGALIVVGDGIYNKGQNPVNLAPNLGFPVYTVGVGDTTRHVDAMIANVRSNKSAYLKNKFPVEIELKFAGLKNQIAYFSIENEGTTIFSGTTNINSDNDFKLEFVNPEAAKPGIQHFKVKLQPLPGEKNLENNEFEFVIRVLENKQKILMLGDGPHPDLGAIRTSLSKLQNYDVKVATGDPALDSLSSYGLIVVNQLPSRKNASNQLFSQLLASHVPLLFVAGPQSMLPQLNSIDVGLKFAVSNATEEVQLRFNTNFSLFALSDATRQTLESMPPLIAPFGNTELHPTIQALAYQSVKGITTGKTALAFGTYKGRKMGFVVGEGLWRWRLADFGMNGSNEAFDELVQKMVQYLALRENEDNFNVYHPAIFQETDNVEFTAELYNDSYELVNSPEVEIVVKDSKQREFRYVFEKTEDHYKLNAGSLAPDDYAFEAKVQLGNQVFSESGNFSVVKNDVEKQNTVADFSVLYQMAVQSGGQFFGANDRDRLVDEIRKNNRIEVKIHRQNIQDEWINLKIMFLLLLVLLSVEWFLRKYWGIY